MISAADALELVKASDVYLEIELLALDKQIREAAQIGLRELFIHHGACEYDLPKIPKLEERVILHLRSLGYGATWTEHGESYVPRAYEQDSGRQFTNYGMKINW